MADRFNVVARGQLPSFGKHFSVKNPAFHCQAAVARKGGEEIALIFRPCGSLWSRNAKKQGTCSVKKETGQIPPGEVLWVLWSEREVVDGTVSVWLYELFLLWTNLLLIISLCSIAKLLLLCLV